MSIRPLVRPLVALLASCACSGYRGGGDSTAPGATAIGVPLPVFQASVDRGEPVAPWTLTASDGSGLMLTRVDARAVFQGPLAFTELHLYFHNPEARVREGTFAITLPAHAAVSRFAMEGAQGWMEAEVVEKMLARRAYEDVLRRRQDPALLEKAAGNQFTARVFPIPASGDKHLVISFSQELAGERYVLPLRGLPRLERIDAQLDVVGPDGKHTEQRLSRRNWQPDGDLISEAAMSAEAVTAGTVVAAQVAMQGDAAAADAPAAVTLLVDTSASRSLGFAAMVQAVRQLIGELAHRHGGDLPIEVIAFDQETRSIFAGSAGAWGEAQDHQLIARGAAGASDLGQAIAWLGARTPHRRVVVVSDVVITAGEGSDEIAARLGRLAQRGVERVDVLLTGGIRDEAAATRLVRAAPRAGAVIDLDAGIAAAVRALDERVQVDVPIDVAGASWVYPRSVPSLRPGTRVMVYARLARPVPPAGAIEVSVGGVRRAIGVVSATPVLVERAAAAAEIAELEGKLDGATGEARRALRADIARRSVAARVISSQTSLLVLETERDYARYGIDRKALADVMVIGPGGLVLEHRAPRLEPSPPPDGTAQRMRAQRKLDADYRLAKPEPVKTMVDHEVPSLDEKSTEANGPAPDQGSDGSPGILADPALPMATAPAGADVAFEAPQAPLRIAPAPPRDAGHRVTIDAGGYLGSRGLAVARDAPDAARAEYMSRRARRETPEAREAREAWPRPDAPGPLTGELAEIERALSSGDRQRALATARGWHAKQPGDVLALIGLGDALEANHELAEASRIYGSIIDLFPGRADLRRFAGERLERVGAEARALAIDTYRRAVQERPDHLSGHRLLAYALLRAGRRAEAFAAVLAAFDQPGLPARFPGADRVLAEDVELIGEAVVAAEPARRAAVVAELDKRHLALDTAPSTRFVLYWETDANDVDFHIQDARGGHAWYSHKQLPSGGELYADITTGYGPECFMIPGTPKAGPYRISIDYYSQGPMGYGMGLLQILRHDGKGGLTFDDRPYVIMNDHAYVDLGRYDQPTQ